MIAGIQISREIAMSRLVLLLLALLIAADIGLAGEPPWLTVPEPPPLQLYKARESGIAQVNGVELYYATFNNPGPDPVILLHGGLSSSEAWGFEVPLLAKSHRVIVVDSRGHGRSTRNAQPFSYDLMASDVVALMDYLALPKASIVGWSDGGIVGMVMAIKHRDRLDRLVTYGASFNHSADKTDPPDDAAKARRAKYMAWAEAKYRAISPTPDGFADLRKALAAMYAKEPNLDPSDLRAVTTPTLIITGEYEQFYTREHFEELSRLIPKSRLVILPNASHGGPNQQPAAFHKIVADFLDAR